MLIANRGEIAVRVVRACAEMGIRSMAIYSDADKNALHVKKADEAYRISAHPLNGYLNADKITSLAAALGCDAVHPGYGFLSESPLLPRYCARHGIKFVGPSAQSIERMGDKVAARALAETAGVPVVPGSKGALVNVNEAVKLAERIGYPVMLKAVGGGGGRGIRRCDNSDEVRHSFDRASSEARKAFGRADVFMEKCVVNPRHIEVQIIADGSGNIVHLFERDCSIQRRNQKLIEIAPSPQLTEKEREEVCSYAIQLALSADYQNAGTVEFLLDEDRRFYFMEMNTRLQVEHTVTEQITGLDIVQEQIRVAAGEPLSVRQKDIHHRGYAMQFRINAEDPRNDFIPSFGRITRYYAPGGPGVRTDGAIYTGYVIPPYYDSMCAKLTVWALSWEALVARGQRALADIVMTGIKTTIPYYQQILKHNDFRRGDFDTGFVAAHPELANVAPLRRTEDEALAIAAALVCHAGM